jgi:hypothetical protein
MEVVSIMRRRIISEMNAATAAAVPLLLLQQRCRRLRLRFVNLSSMAAVILVVVALPSFIAVVEELSSFSVFIIIITSLCFASLASFNQRQEGWLAGWPRAPISREQAAIVLQQAAACVLTGLVARCCCSKESDF